MPLTGGKHRVTRCAGLGGPRGGGCAGCEGSGLIAHGFAEDIRHAAKLSLDAGLDMSMQSGAFLDHAADLVADGSLTMATLDTAVRRVLEVKARMGLFDNPYRSLDPEKEAAPADHIADHDALARTRAGAHAM